MPTECTQQMLEFAHRRAFPPIPRLCHARFTPQPETKGFSDSTLE
jgi:hypothetical protein